MEDVTLVAIEEEDINDKLIDYAGTRWSKEAYVFVERRVRINPVPESFSIVPAIMNDRQLVDNPNNDLLY